MMFELDNLQLQAYLDLGTIITLPLFVQLQYHTLNLPSPISINSRFWNPSNCQVPVHRFT